jgi:outer membrane protein OmpA-like peptidoglycan-associated protein
MRTLLIAGSILALAVPAAHAQQAPKAAVPAPKAAAPAAVAPAAQMQKFLVFFDWNKDTLTTAGAQVVAQAAEAYKKGSGARIVVTGHTDTSGSAAYNMRLSVRRAETVKREMVRLGVPTASIVTIGKGQTDLLVPTGDGVREAQNRRVEIELPRPPAPPPPPAPVAKAAPPPPPPPAPKGSVSIGPWYGYNIREKDPVKTFDPATGGLAFETDSKSSNLLGPEVRADYEVIPGLLVVGEAAAFNTLGSADGDGYGARFAAGPGYQFDLGSWHPWIGVTGGYIFGKGVQDGAIVGPQIGLKYDFARNWGLYSRVGYDYNFRNQLGQGIINTGIGAAYRF